DARPDYAALAEPNHLFARHERMSRAAGGQSSAVIYQVRSGTEVPGGTRRQQAADIEPGSPIVVRCREACCERGGSGPQWPPAPLLHRPQAGESQRFLESMVGVTGFEPATPTSRILSSIVLRRSQSCAKSL